MSGGYRIANDLSRTEAFCKDCRCWYHETEDVEMRHVHPDAPDTIVKSVALKLAECRRYPPYTFDVKGKFPSADPLGWCGEFRP